jgi:hypothetical protein
MPGRLPVHDPAVTQHHLDGPLRRRWSKSQEKRPQADRLAGQARPSGAQERQDRTVGRKSPEPPDHAPALDDDLAGGLRADLWVGSLPPALDDAGAIGGALRRHLRGPATAHRSRPGGLATRGRSTARVEYPGRRVLRRNRLLRGTHHHRLDGLMVRTPTPTRLLWTHTQDVST